MNKAPSSRMSRIATMESNRISTRAFFAVFPLIRTREHMLSVQPIPSSLTVSVAPFGRVIVANRPDKCAGGDALSSLLVTKALAPCEVNVPMTSSITAKEVARMIGIFINNSPLVFVNGGLDRGFVFVLRAKTDVSCGNSTGTVDDESRGY